MRLAEESFTRVAAPGTPAVGRRLAWKKRAAKIAAAVSEDVLGADPLATGWVDT